MSDERCCNGSGGVFLAFLAGGLIGAGLALLDARTGRVLSVTRRAPLDAAFGAEGRLYLLEPGSVRVVR